MLDANDIQIITQIVSTALAENNKVLRSEMQKNVSELREEMQKNNDSLRSEMLTIIESEVNPKLQLLAEGHEVLLEKLNRIEKQGDLVDRIVVVEEAVKHLNREINALKKAQ